MSAYKDLRAVILGQFIEAWFAAPARGVLALIKINKRTRKDVQGTTDANDELREFPLSPLVHDWRWEGELVHQQPCYHCEESAIASISYTNRDTLSSFPRSAVSHASRAYDGPHFLRELHPEVLLETSLAQHMSTAFHGGHQYCGEPLGTGQAIRQGWLRAALCDDGRNGLLELLHLTRLPEDDEETEVPHAPEVAPRDVDGHGGTRGHLGVCGPNLVVKGLL